AAVVSLSTRGLVCRAARRHDFTAHRDWMMRNYALTFLAVTSRVVVPLLLLVQRYCGRVRRRCAGSRSTRVVLAPRGGTADIESSRLGARSVMAVDARISISAIVAGGSGGSPYVAA